MSDPSESSRPTGGDPDHDWSELTPAQREATAALAQAVEQLRTLTGRPAGGALDHDWSELTSEQREATAALAQAVEQLRTLGSPARSAARLGIGTFAARVVFGRFSRVRRLAGRRLKFLLVGVVVMLLSVTTCSAGVDPSTLTSDYGPPVPSTVEAATGLVTKIGTALQDIPNTGTLRLSMTETEATSALSLGMMVPELLQAMETITPDELRASGSLEELRERLWAREAEAPIDPTLRGRILSALNPRLRTGDIQIRFSANGEVAVAGFIQAWRWRQPALLVVAPRARDGSLELDFVRGRLGRLPAPEWAFDQLGRLVSSVILLGSDYAEISELSVTGGRLVLVGRVNL